MRFNVAPSQRVLMLGCVTLLCFIVASVLAGVVLHGGMSGSKVVIVTVVQDLMVFVLPAIVTAVIVTRYPADLLSLRSTGGATVMALTVAALLASVPFMNVVISWNESLSLPESMAGVEQWMRDSEVAAREMIGTMIVGGSIVSLVLTLLVIGLLAGFSEELFFRGALQRILQTYPVNAHVAVWTTAVIFSAVHMQFFGFVPRLLLGAFFGYVALWSGSIVPSMLAHVVNNMLAATGLWLAAGNGGVKTAIEQIGVGASGNVQWGSVAMSVVMTGALLVLLYRVCRRRDCSR